MVAPFKWRMGRKKILDSAHIFLFFHQITFFRNWSDFELNWQSRWKFKTSGFETIELDTELPNPVLTFKLLNWWSKKFLDFYHTMSINSKTALHRRLLYFILLTWRPGVRFGPPKITLQKKRSCSWSTYLFRTYSATKLNHVVFWCMFAFIISHQKMLINCRKKHNLILGCCDIIY